MISVIILSKNNGETLDGCLRSIVNSDGNKETIVVDAHSTDKTPEIVKRYKDQIEVVYDDGKGIGIARNIGVEASNGDIVCFVDADAFVSKDHFTKIEVYFKEKPDVGVVHVQGALSLSETPTYVEKLGYAYRNTRQKKTHVYVGGYFMAVRRKAFYDVGGFWEFPPFGADDADFVLRAMEKGWKKGLIHTEGWHQCRRTMVGVWREMWVLGKGRACFHKKYSDHPCVGGFKIKQRLLARILGKQWRYSELTPLLAPITGLRYIFKWKSLGIYFYYVVRAWALTFGYMWGWLTWAKNIQQG